MALAVSRKGENSATGSMTTTGLSVTLDGTPASGELMLAKFSCRGGSLRTITPPGDWTLVPDSRVNNGTNTAVALYFKIAGSSESTTQGAWTLDTAGAHSTLIIQTFSGHDTVTPLGTVGTNTGSGTSQGVTASSGLSSGTTYGFFGGWANNNTTTYTKPAEQTESNQISTSGGANITGLGAYELATTGATSYTRTASVAASGQWAAALVPINIASSSGESKSYSDSATGSESAGVTSALTAGEGGSGQDRAAVTSASSLTDSGTGSDSASAAASASVGDTGVGQEQAGVAGSLTATDSGAGSESPAVAATLTVTDSATGAESFSVEISSGDEISVTFTDSATGQEVATVTATLTAGDNATGDAMLTIGVAVAPADSATGAEGATVSASVGPGDSASGDEGMTGEGALVMADSATGHDSISVVVTTPGEVAPTTMCVHLTIDGIEAVTLTITTTEGVTLALEGC